MRERDRESEREREKETDTDRQGSMAGLTSVVRSISIIIIIIYFKMQFAQRDEGRPSESRLVKLNELLCCMPSGSRTDEDI